jgi:exonuclease SbcD
LTAFIKEKMVDVLLVSGDIFDSTVPSNHVQKQYYQFLSSLMKSCCRHIIITGGNHDSPTQLNAPSELLKGFNIYVVGAVNGKNVRDEIITLKDTAGKPELIVCAVPYLRDKDIRTVEAGESIEDKASKLIEGITGHYQEIGRIAAEEKLINGGIPVIAMGHLFTTGGCTTEGDGVRELYVGTLAHVGADIFPACFDYVALGHLHLAQPAGDLNHIRYSGSPIPMSFGEADQEKKVILADFEPAEVTITEYPIPCFQQLVSISGDEDLIAASITKLKEEDSTAWLQVDYIGKLTSSEINQKISDIVDGSKMEVRRIKNRRVADKVLNREHDLETLDSLGLNDVFARCLDAHEKTGEEREGLLRTFEELIQSFNEKDVNAQ